MNKKILIILGPGRSGTSVLTKILISLGMKSSKELIGASVANPEGAFEDKEIFNLNLDMLGSVGLSSRSPVITDLTKKEEIKRYVPKLKKIIERRYQELGNSWGFKDPKICSVLPIWIKIFNDMHVTPKYLFSIRDPSSVIESMVTHYNTNPEISELVWLTRTCDSLYYTDCNCFIVHYEDWFTEKAKTLATDIAQFVGLRESVNTQNMDELLSGIVKKSLNRSSCQKYEVINPLVKTLYSELEKCHGDEFDRKRLMDVVVSCRLAIKSFSSWYMLSKKLSNKINQKEIIAKMNEQKKEVVAIRNREKNHSIRIASLNNELESTRKGNYRNKEKIKVLKERILEKNKLIKERTSRKDKHLLELKTSFSYILGNIFVKAIKKPGKNTILLPFRILRLVFKTIFSTQESCKG